MVVLCEQCFPAHADHGQYSMVPTSRCAQCGSHDDLFGPDRTAINNRHMFVSDPRVGMVPLVERLAREAGFERRPGAAGIRHPAYGDDATLRRFAALVAEECAREADEEERIRTDAGRKHEEESAPRDRCFAAARAAINIAHAIRAKFKEQQ